MKNICRKHFVLETLCSYITWDSKPGFILSLFFFFFFFQNQGFFSYKFVLIKKESNQNVFAITEHEKIRKNQKNLRNAKFLDKVGPGLPGKTLGAEGF